MLERDAINKPPILSNLQSNCIFVANAKAFRAQLHTTDPEISSQHGGLNLALRRRVHSVQHSIQFRRHLPFWVDGDNGRFKVSKLHAS